MPELEKRTWVYVMRPKDYEIAGCECGNDDPDWSEFKHHLWCQRCQKDFIPSHDGVFDGPIPIGASHLMGMCFSTIDIATGTITKDEYCAEMAAAKATSPPAQT